MPSISNLVWIKKYKNTHAKHTHACLCCGCAMPRFFFHIKPLLACIAHGSACTMFSIGRNQRHRVVFNLFLNLMRFLISIKQFYSLILSGSEKDLSLHRRWKSAVSDDRDLSKRWQPNFYFSRKYYAILYVTGADKHHIKLGIEIKSRFSEIT